MQYAKLFLSRKDNAPATRQQDTKSKQRRPAPISPAHPKPEILNTKEPRARKENPTAPPHPPPHNHQKQREKKENTHTHTPHPSCESNPRTSPHKTQPHTTRMAAAYASHDTNDSDHEASKTKQKKATQQNSKTRPANDSTSKPQTAPNTRHTYVFGQEMAQGSSSPLSILTATTTTREANTREHNLKEHYNEHGSGFPWSHYPTAAVPQFAIRAPDSLQMQVESLVNIMFDPTAQSIITDEQIRHWQLYLQNKTYADPYYTFPNDFIHDCIFHFNSALHREVKGFIQHAIHHIHHNKEHQPNIKLILWQRNLRFRCKVQPFPFSTWRQLIYDAELDDLANSVGFTFREEQL